MFTAANVWPSVVFFTVIYTPPARKKSCTDKLKWNEHVIKPQLSTIVQRFFFHLTYYDGSQPLSSSGPLKPVLPLSSCPYPFSPHPGNLAANEEFSHTASGLHNLDTLLMFYTI